MTKLTGAILAGGGSARMGRDKAFIEVGGAPMIESVIDALKPYVSELVIIANDKEAYEKLGLPVYRDIILGMGPLSGLYTAFTVTGADTIFLAACDMPLIDQKIVSYLADYPDWEGDALVPVVNDREQGLLAIYRRSSIDKMREEIENVELKFNTFRRRLDKCLVTEDELMTIDPTLKTFINMNNPEDLKSVGRGG